MADAAHSPEALFVENLHVIERAAASFGRRYGMSADAVAELSSAIKARIVEEDYAVFRKFRGESSLATYLTVVVTMFAREERVREHGRWRPSMAARRQGAVGVKLETLVHRKGYPLGEAGAVMRARGETALSDRELGEMLQRLPRRAPLRPAVAPASALDGLAAPSDAGAAAEAGDIARRRRSVEKLLEASMASLSLEDRLLIKLRFWEDVSIADAARILGVDQRPLYRRMERLFAQMQGLLLREGITANEIRELIEESA